MDEGSIALTPAVRIMYQISTAIAHMHELGICHCAVRAENVLLMQSVLIDPIAKLSNLSQCQRKVWRFKTDIVDWAANKRFKILKFKFKFPIGRTFEMIGLVLGCIEAKFCK